MSRIDSLCDSKKLVGHLFVRHVFSESAYAKLAEIMHVGKAQWDKPFRLSKVTWRKRSFCKRCHWLYKQHHEEPRLQFCSLHRPVLIDGVRWSWLAVPQKMELVFIKNRKLEKALTLGVYVVAQTVRLILRKIA